MLFLKDRGFHHPHSDKITPQNVYLKQQTLLHQLTNGAANATLAK